MKKTLIIAIAALALLASCAEKTDSTGYVTFGYGSSRDVTASIGYPQPESQVWTVTAVKNGRGASTGQGTYDEVLLTDTLGPFSTGTWTFTFDSDVYHGESSVEITEGINQIDVNVTSKGETGTLRFTGCTIPEGSTGIYIDLDGKRILGMGSQYMTERENGGYEIPVREQETTVGIHDVSVTYNGTDRTESFKVRIAAGLVTSVTFGIFEGSPLFNVTIDEQEALVDE